jgi:hypothetical protein
MARLTEPQQREIVVMLARFFNPAEVQRFFKVEYGIVVSIQQVVAYDLRNPQFRAAAKWRSLYEATQKAYIEHDGAIPIANRGFRLNLLQEAALDARHRRNYPLLLSILEQAAKEMGGALTNRREIDLTADRPSDELSEGERLLRVAAIFDKALGNEPKKGGGLQ